MHGVTLIIWIHVQYNNKGHFDNIINPVKYLRAERTTCTICYALVSNAAEALGIGRSPGGTITLVGMHIHIKIHIFWLRKQQ